MGQDVVIIGAGIIGCATAYFLAREGLSVTVVDPNGIAAGASGRNNGLIEHTYDDATEAIFNETVGLLTDVLGDTFPRDPVGTLLVAVDEHGAQQVAAGYHRFPQLAPQILNPDQAREAEPLLAEGLWGVMLDTGHPVRPVEATTAFADLAKAAGAEFVLGQPVELPSDGSEVVIAAGAGSPSLLPAGIRKDIVAPLWGVIVSVELPQRPRHPLIEGALAAAHGSGEIAIEAPFTLLDSPSWLAVGSTMLEGSEPDGAAWAPLLLERGRRFVPSIAQAEVKGLLVCARPRSFDNRPILGRVPGQERLWLATGHGGRGMSTGAASGRMIAEAIIAGDDSAIPDPLSSRRLADR